MEEIYDSFKPTNARARRCKFLIDGKPVRKDLSSVALLLVRDIVSIRNLILNSKTEVRMTELLTEVTRLPNVFHWPPSFN